MFGIETESSTHVPHSTGACMTVSARKSCTTAGVDLLWCDTKQYMMGLISGDRHA